MVMLVIGRGWTGLKVGLELYRRGIAHQMCSHEEAFDFLLAARARPHYAGVINCAGVVGRPTVDWCEDNKEVTIQGNAVFPVEIANICEKYNFHLTHFSSGCIYQGGPWTEDDPPNFDGSVYSASKMASDLALKDKALVLRIRMPFDNSDSPKNLLMKLRKYGTSAKLIDSTNSLSDLDEMVSLGISMALDKTIGTFNMVNQGAISTKEIAEMLGLRDVEWFTHEEFKSVTKAPRSICTLTSKIKTTPVREALTRAIRSMNG